MADLVFTVGTLHEGVVGRPYEAGLALDAGATVVTAHSISAGALPPGLTLDASVLSQRIAGTPTTPGTYTFTVSCTDTAGAVTKSYTIMVLNSAGDNEKTGNLTATESAQKRRLN